MGWFAYCKNAGDCQFLESRNGSEAVVTRTVFGTQYVDEVVRWSRDGRGVMFVYQDANYNVVATADYDGKVLERVRLTPYGQPTFDVETVNGGERSERPRTAIGKADTKSASGSRAGPQRVSTKRTSEGYDGDGDTDSADSDTLSNTCLGDFSGPCRIFDYGERSEPPPAAKGSASLGIRRAPQSGQRRYWPTGLHTP